MSIKEKLLRNKKAVLPLIAVLAVIILLIIIFSAKAVHRKNEQKQIDAYLNQKIETYGKINIVSDAALIDGEKNTIAGVKEAFRLGAETITLDLCFNENDVPVICDDYDSIKKDTLKLEEVFKLLKDEKYSDLRINLRLRQLGSLNKFNDLLKKYKMSGRVIISGINKNRYSLISGSSTAAGVFFDYVPSKNRKDALNEIIALKKEYNIAGVIISCKDITQELVETLNQRGITFIIGKTDTELDMYAVLSSGANNIETSAPEKLKDVYSLWKERTRDSVNKSVLNKLQ